MEGAEFEFWKLDLLSDAPSLRVFNNRGNRLHMENDTNAEFFSNNHELEQLFLSDNGLSAIPSKEFSHLTKLKVLDLSHNQLTKVSFALPTSGRLRSLKLNNNALQTLPVNMRQQLDEIAVVQKEVSARAP